MQITKIKTITVKGDTEEFDKRVNEASKLLTVFATQTHVSVVQGAGVCPEVLYTAVLFYKAEQ